MSSVLSQQAFKQFNEKKYLKVEKTLTKIKSKNYALQKLELQTYYNLKKYLKATTLLESLLKLTSAPKELAEVYFFVGICFSNVGQKEQAIKCLERSVAKDGSITNRYAVSNLFNLYHQVENYRKLDSLALKLIKWQEFYINTLVILAKSYAKREDKEKLVETTIKIIPHAAELCEQDFVDISQFIFATELVIHAEKYITSYEKSHNLVAYSTRADLMLHLGRYTEVVNYLNDSLLKRLNRSGLYYLTAKALDKLKNYNLAYKYFTIAGELKSKELDDSLQDQYIQRWLKLASNKNLKELIDSQVIESQEESLNMLFVFGFPRSGTTLLDNILDTQSKTIVLSEKDALSSVVEKFKSLNNRYPEDIAKLQPKDLVLLREHYFEYITNLGYNLSGMDLLVDKGPHHTDILPLIHLLFPQAKLVASIRHPLDTCLSCIQQNFITNYYNNQLLTMESTIQRYINVFNLLEKYEENFGLNIHYIRYEDIVSDFEVTITKLANYLELNLEKGYKEFHKYSAKKYITSASRGQTEKALYNNAVYKWHNYEEYLMPYKDRLLAFINKFGYQNE